MKYIECIIIMVFWYTAYAADLLSIDTAKLWLPGKWGTKDITSLTTQMKSVLGILQDITAIIAVIGICIVGIMYITSQWNEEKTEAAKKYMITIIVGVILAFAAWGIMSLINIIPNSFNL